MSGTQNVAHANGGHSQFQSPHGPLRRIKCAQQHDGTFQIQHLEEELVPHMQSGFDPDEFPTTYNLPAPEPESADVDVVFVSTTDFSTLPIFAEHAKGEKKDNKTTFRYSWPQDLVMRSRSVTSSTTTIEWRRPYRISGYMSSDFYSSYYPSKWLYMKGALTSIDRSGDSLGVLLRVVLVQTSERLAIGLLQPRPLMEINGGKRIETHVWDEVSQRLASQPNTTPATLHKSVLEALYHVILADEHQILSQMESCLCDIDSSMEHDHEVQRFTKHWRRVVGSWRAHLHGRVRFSTQLQLILPSSGQGGHLPLVVDPAKYTREVPNTNLLYSTLPKRNETVTAHCEATFAALMATMSIIESQIAIKEAVGVTRLTQLAFFFIPVTVASGIFGMNIREFTDPAPSIWMFVLTWIAAAAGAYFVLYGWFARLVWRPSWFRIRKWKLWAMMNFHRRAKKLKTWFTDRMNRGRGSMRGQREENESDF